jgi:hypothetical protein
MNWQVKIASLEAQVEFLRAENDRMHSMLTAACEQINILHNRIDNAEKTTKAADESMTHRFGVIDLILKDIGHKLYPTFYKVFPGAIEAEDALKRAVTQTRKKPKR